VSMSVVLTGAKKLRVVLLEASLAAADVVTV
jgi:hypothetical protein